MLRYSIFHRVYYNAELDSLGLYLNGMFSMGPGTLWGGLTPQNLGGAGWVFICLLDNA